VQESYWVLNFLDIWETSAQVIRRGKIAARKSAAAVADPRPPTQDGKENEENEEEQEKQEEEVGTHVPGGGGEGAN
jgi:hypothetical protein